MATTIGAATTDVCISTNTNTTEGSISSRIHQSNFDLGSQQRSLPHCRQPPKPHYPTYPSVEPSTSTRGPSAPNPVNLDFSLDLDLPITPISTHIATILSLDTSATFLPFATAATEAQSPASAPTTTCIPSTTIATSNSTSLSIATALTSPAILTPSFATSTSSSNSFATPTFTPTVTMNQPGQYGGAAPRRTNTYGSQHDELHLSPTITHQGQVSPRDFSTSSGPHIKLDQPSSQGAAPQYQGGSSNNSSVPNVLQPGGLSVGRPVPMNANTAPTLPTMSGAIQQSPTEYTPSRPTLSTTHSYSRTSPGTSQNYDTSSSYVPYTPTTPGGSSAAGPSQYMSPQDKYGAPGSQRNIANTPLGLADIRPRADSTLSDGPPGTLGYDLANTQPSTSNYLAQWPLYAFDWCKWAPQGKGAGKVAIGSYLEDGHNFVRLSYTKPILMSQPTPPI